MENLKENEVRISSTSVQDLINQVVKKNVIPKLTGVVCSLDKDNKPISDTYHLLCIKNETNISITHKTAYLIYYTKKLEMCKMNLSVTEKEFLSKIGISI